MREIKEKVILVRVSGRFELSGVNCTATTTQCCCCCWCKDKSAGGNHMHDMQGVDPDRLPSYYVERNG